MGKLIVYRYDDSVLGKLFRMVRSSLLPATVALKQASALAVGVNLYRFIFDLPKDNIYVLSSEELNKFTNAHNNQWIEGNQYYVQHPKEQCSGILIEADQFVKYIEDERISEIIAYIFQNCNPKNSITIKSSNLKNSKGKTKTKISIAPEESMDSLGIDAEIAGNAGKTKSLVEVVTINCHDINDYKKKEYMDRKFVWIDEFKKLKAAVVSNAFTIEEKIDNAWGAGIDAKLAKQINLDFDINYDKKYSLYIEVK